jgi:antitoxin (DNA-binding transcriptional repressor) of toxin-antitoxin stability system
MQVNVLDKEKQLLELLEKVKAGEKVILSKSGEVVARIVPFKQGKVRQKGLLKGKIWMSADVDQTDREIIDSFYNSRLFPDDKE